MKVLVVDGVAGFAETLTELLEIEGYRAAFATDGQAAITSLKSFRPECVVINLFLAGAVDAFKTATAARRARPSCVLVGTTESGEPRLHQRALASGFNAVLSGPASMHRLLKILQVRRLGYGSAEPEVLT